LVCDIHRDTSIASSAVTSTVFSRPNVEMSTLSRRLKILWMDLRPPRDDASNVRMSVDYAESTIKYEHTHGQTCKIQLPEITSHLNSHVSWFLSISSLELTSSSQAHPEILPTDI
jgi:hypothetical protein